VCSIRRRNCLHVFGSCNWWLRNSFLIPLLYSRRFHSLFPSFRHSCWSVGLYSTYSDRPILIKWAPSCTTGGPLLLGDKLYCHCISVIKSECVTTC
jgi:hypothetical protein